MATPFGDLNEENLQQINKFLRFFRQKRESVLRSIHHEFQDIKHDKLQGDLFSREDMEEFADFVHSAVRSQVGHEVSTIINMGALAVSQLLERAQENGFNLVLETAAVENQVILEAIEKMNLDALPKKPMRGIGGDLVSLKDEAKAQKEERERLEESNRQLQAQVSALNRRILNAERAARDAQSSASASLAEGKYNEESSGEQIRRLERLLEEAKEENNKRVSETAQFQQMRKMMQSQSSKIRDLRRRLERYEPDAADSKGDDMDD